MAQALRQRWRRLTPPDRKNGNKARDLTRQQQHSTASPAATSAQPRNWTRTLAPYREPSHTRSVLEIAITFLPFAGLWALAWTTIHLGYWQLSLLPSLVAAGLLVQLPITLCAAALGVWLFYVQHQFAETYWAEEGEWSLNEAALRGSSHYDLPGVLRWFTANIGMHHIHHLSSRIPFYRLSRVLRDFPELKGVSRLTLRQSLGCVRLALWDETQRRLISFREARSSKAPNS